MDEYNLADLEETKPNRILISELPANKEPILSVSLKPYRSFIFSIIIGIALFFTMNIAFIIFGIFIIAISVYFIVKIPDRKIIDFYSDSFVVYPVRSDGYCQRVLWDEVVEWNCKVGKAQSDTLTVKLSAGDAIYIESVQSVKIVRMFNKYAEKKSSNAIMQQNMTKTKFKWPWKKNKKK